MSNNVDKNNLRKLIHTRRKALDIEFQQHASQQICQQLIALEYLQKARVIALYCSAHGEADPIAITEHSFSIEKLWLLPALVKDNNLIFLPLESNADLDPNQYGIPEPNLTLPPVPVTEIDVILLPLVAFDTNCNRLGRGKGYYDKTLAHCKRDQQKLIGIAYDFQKVEDLHPESWDVDLDFIVTEKAIYTNPNIT